MAPTALKSPSFPVMVRIEAADTAKLRAGAKVVLPSSESHEPAAWFITMVLVARIAWSPSTMRRMSRLERMRALSATKSISTVVVMVCSSVPIIWTVPTALISMLPSVEWTSRLSLVPEAEVEVKLSSSMVVAESVVSAWITVERASILISSGVTKDTAPLLWSETPVVLSSPPALRDTTSAVTPKVVVASMVISTSASKRISSDDVSVMSASEKNSTEPPPRKLMQGPSRSRVDTALTKRPVVACTSTSPLVAVKKSFVVSASMERYSSPAVTNSTFLPLLMVMSEPGRVSR
mmetsp:Transcript_113557/g.159227  ORF Transcript_113557/g.159227 Transcript_113557/m.159227 type:complete len:293 (-) Transcript_113557:546-1424(-)